MLSLSLFTFLHFISKSYSIWGGPCSPRHFSAWQIESVRKICLCPSLSLMIGEAQAVLECWRATFSLCRLMECLKGGVVLVLENAFFLSGLCASLLRCPPRIARQGLPQIIEGVGKLQKVPRVTVRASLWQ